MVEMETELSVSEELMVPVPFRAFPSIKVQCPCTFLFVFLTRVFMHFKNRVVVMKLLINQLKRISLVVDATTA